MDLSTMIALTSVCRTSYDWITPIFYRSVTLCDAQQISRFHAARNAVQEIHPHYKLILSLWIGPTAYRDSDLKYGSSSWPITIIDRILNFCTNLRSLHLIDLDQNQWYRIEDAIPQSLESLTMGPSHGPLRMDHMKHKPRIQHFTSAQAYMRDDEVRDFVLSSHSQTFRRISPVPQFFFVDQAACVSQSKTLRVMELIFQRATELQLRELQGYLQNTMDDPRIVITVNENPSWKEIVRAEFQMEQMNHLGE